jgi:hypothetical protein
VGTTPVPPVHDAAPGDRPKQPTYLPCPALPCGCNKGAYRTCISRQWFCVTYSTSLISSSGASSPTIFWPYIGKTSERAPGPCDRWAGPAACWEQPQRPQVPTGHPPHTHNPSGSLLSPARGAPLAARPFPFFLRSSNPVGDRRSAPDRRCFTSAALGAETGSPRSEVHHDEARLRPFLQLRLRPPAASRPDPTRPLPAPPLLPPLVRCLRSPAPSRWPTSSG